MDNQVFQTPGLADQGVNSEALTAWNDRVKSALEHNVTSPFLVLDPRDIDDAQDAEGFRWPANPREPLDCLGEDLAARMSDMGWACRAELHNEYLEYALVMRPDHKGRMRPKRFVATTELVEWWQTMAVHDLEYFLKQLGQVTRRIFSADELFGVSASAWANMGIAERSACFRRRLVGAGPFEPPEHPVNIEHAVFMANKANSLADLISVVHRCSFPSLASDQGDDRRARLDEVLAPSNRQDLLCRSSLFTLAQDAYDLACIEGSDPPLGRAMAFADPFGIFIRSFRTDDLFLGNTNTPADWLRWSSRGGKTPMRLEFGPQDDEPRFLDEVTLGTGALARPISGYALAGMLEVGPLVKVAKHPRQITRVEFARVPAADPEQVVCGLPDTERCRQISEFADLCDADATRNGTCPDRLDD